MDEARPLRISWTRLRSHEECPAKGQLVADGHKSRVTDVRMFFHGTVVDSCMRQWLAQDAPERGWMAARVDQILEAEEAKSRDTGDGIVRWKNAQDKQEVRELCRELVTRLEVILVKQCLPYGWQPASRFVAKISVPYLDGKPRVIELSGETDLLIETPAGLGVYDLKATRDPDYWRKVTGQLVFYEIAMRILTGKWPVVSGLIQPLCEQQVMEFQFTEEDRRVMLTRIAGTATDIWKGNTFPKASSEGCQYCPVRHACPKYKSIGGRVSLAAAAGAGGHNERRPG